MKKKDLTFKELQDACAKRLPLAFPECQTWSEADWIMATVGELGELANILKKIKRGSKKITKKTVKEVELELADTITYLCGFLANCLGINAGEVTREKFNIVSKRYNCSVKL